MKPTRSAQTTKGTNMQKQFLATLAPDTVKQFSDVADYAGVVGVWQPVFGGYGWWVAVFNQDVKPIQDLYLHQDEVVPVSVSTLHAVMIDEALIRIVKNVR